MNCARCGVELAVERDPVGKCWRLTHPPLPDVAVMVGGSEPPDMTDEDLAFASDILHDPEKGGLNIPKRATLYRDESTYSEPSP